jgi:hypothetical protein
VLWTELNVIVKDDRGNWQPQTFRVDSATDMTTMPAYDCMQMGIPMPQNPAPGLVHEQTALPIRAA